MQYICNKCDTERPDLDVFIVDEVMPNLGATVVSTDIGRMLQLIKAAEWNK